MPDGSNPISTRPGPQPIIVGGDVAIDARATTTVAAPVVRTVAQVTTIPSGFQAVGRGGANRAEDVRFIREMLVHIYPNNTDLRAEMEDAARSGRITPALQNAITQFQTENNIRNRSGNIDGRIDTGTDGTRAPTLTMMRERARAAMAAEAAATPTPVANPTPAAPVNPANPPANPVVPAADSRGNATVSAAPAAAPAAPRTLAQRMFLDFPAANRAGQVWDEEFGGGWADIRDGISESNAGMVIQGGGAILGGAVRMIGTVASYPIGFVGNLADMGFHAAWDKVEELWNRGGAGNVTLAILLAIPAVLCKIAAIALNAVAALIDAVFKFFGETIIEGLISWLGGALGGRSENESDLRASERERLEREARLTHERERRTTHTEDRMAAVRAERARQVEARESEIRGVETDLANKRQAIRRLEEMGASRSAAQTRYLTSLRTEVTNLDATLTDMRAELAALKASPLPEPAPAVVTPPTPVPTPP